MVDAGFFYTRFLNTRITKYWKTTFIKNYPDLSILQLPQHRFSELPERSSVTDTLSLHRSSLPTFKPYTRHPYLFSTGQSGWCKYLRHLTYGYYFVVRERHMNLGSQSKSSRILKWIESFSVGSVLSTHKSRLEGVQEPLDNQQYLWDFSDLSRLIRFSRLIRGDGLRQCMWEDDTFRVPMGLFWEVHCPTCKYDCYVWRLNIKVRVLVTEYPGRRQVQKDVYLRR